MNYVNLYQSIDLQNDYDHWRDDTDINELLIDNTQ